MMKMKRRIIMNSSVIVVAISTSWINPASRFQRIETVARAIQ